MNWYLSKIIFQIICGSGNHTPQFDEQLRLIAANDEEEALNKANEIGEREQETFWNEQRRLVQWRFVAVTELYKFSEKVDGAEIFSRIEERDDPDTYITTAHRKATMLSENQSPKMLHLV